MSRAFHAASAASVFVALAVGACSGGGNGSSEAAPAVRQREAARVRTARVEVREMVHTLSTTTTVESEHQVEIVPRSDGVVMRIAVEEGDKVEAGAVLAELDRRQTRAAIESARIAIREAEDAAKQAQFALAEAENRVAATKLRWEQATREHDRNEKAGMISAQALDNLRVARDTAKAEHDGALLGVDSARSDIQALATQKAKAEVELQRAEIQDGDMIVTAPFAGTIAGRGLNVGDTAGRVRNAVGQISPAFVLTDPSKLRAIVFRPQRELPIFLAAQRAVQDSALEGSDGAELEISATSEALPGRRFRGEIKLVSPTVDPTSGSFRVTVSLPAAEPGQPGLLPGMLVRIEIVTDRHANALVVPKRALRREGGSNFVFVVAENRARRVEVVEGFSDEDATEVIPREPGLLTAGARVIVVGNREIEDGAEVIEEAATPANPPAPERAASEAATTETEQG